MSNDRPVPPSIPPRKRPVGSVNLRPSTVPPRIVAPLSEQAAVAPITPAPAFRPAAVAPAPVPTLRPIQTAPALVPTLKPMPTVTRSPVLPVRPAPGLAPDRIPLVTVTVAAPATFPVKVAGPGRVGSPVAPVGGGSPQPASALTTAVPVVRKALKSASSAITGAAASVTGEFSRMVKHPSTTAGGSPGTDSTKAGPTIAATDTQSPQAPSRATKEPQSARLPAPSAAREGAQRRVRLSLSRVDPWSVMKMSFLLSVAIGIMIVVAAAVIWFVLDGLAVFTKVNLMLTEIAGKESPLDILQYVGFGRVVSGATMIAVLDVILLTALSTIGAFLYNITAALVGGVSLTLTDD